MKYFIATMLGLLLTMNLAASAAAAGEAGAPIDVAPKAEGSRAQSWAHAAWSEGAKCWLAVWREGYLNEPEAGTDIWCARVSAEGKALDPTGIRLTKGKGLKDTPRVSSDGKDFLVVWEDLSNGKDWDVRGARVSGEGKALDADPLTLAGGEHNQCRPDVAFSGSTGSPQAGGSYLMVYQNFGGKGFPGYGAGYGIESVRVASDGKASAPQRLKLALGSPDGQEIDPAVASRGGEALVLGVKHLGGEFGDTYLGWRTVDAKGVFIDKPLPNLSERDQPKSATFGDTRDGVRVRYSAAMGTDGYLAAAGGRYYRGGNFRLYRIGLTGDLVGNPEYVQWVGKEWPAMLPCVSLTFDGEKFLLAGEWANHDKPGRAEIHGYFIGADGKILSDVNKGFTIAADAAKDQVMPAAAGGPKGVSLVVYSENRGVDDVKLVARLVKNP